MKRAFLIVALLLGLTAGVAAAQTRVGVTLSFGSPYYGGHVFIGRPYYHRFWYPRFYREPVVVVGPRFYRARRFHVRRYYRHW